MNTLRRNVLKGAAGASAVAVAVAAGLLKPTQAMAAWNKTAFEAKSVTDAMKGIGATSPADSKDITIKAPDIAENGAVVPVEVTSGIAGTTSIAILA
ncbi:MAG: thiosulfate oxidation carrier protein SoxY, partial [Hydrogenophilales bacterium 16-64-40]